MSTKFRSTHLALFGATVALLFGCSGESADASGASGPSEANAASTASATEDGVTAAEGEAELGTRYKAGQTLDTGIDLSKVKFDDPAPSEPVAEVHDPHDGHGHGEVLPDEGGLQPAGARYLGGISLVEGAEKIHDFGLIREGESAEYAFELVSDGREPLQITGVKPSCGCTKAEIEVYDENGEPKPHERGTLIPIGGRFRLVTAISAEGKKGAFSATVSVNTNAPGGAFNVRLMAEAEPVLVVETKDPDSGEWRAESNLFLGQLTTEDQVEREVRVTSKRGEAFALSFDAEALPSVLKVDATPVDPDGEGKSAEWTVKLVAGPGLPVGVRNYPASMTSDIVMPHPKYPNPDGSPKYYSAPIAVQARVTGMVSAEPAFVGFGMIRPGEAAERTIRIESHDDYALTDTMEVRFEGIYGGEFEHADRCTYEIDILDEGKIADLRVMLSGLPDTVNGSFGGILKVMVGHPSMEELVIRFSGVCRAGLPTRGGN